MDNHHRISLKINGEYIEPSPKEQSATEPDKKEFSWILPEKTEITPPKKTKKPMLRKKKTNIKKISKKGKSRKSHGVKRHQQWMHQKKRRAFSKKHFLPAFLAMAVGLVMGWVVLAVFTNHMSQTTAAGSRVNTVSTNQTTPTSAVSEPNLTLYVVQGAVFSKKNNAQDAMKKLQDDGFPSILNQSGGQIHLFIGMATQKSAATALGDLYQKQGQDIWIKSLQIKEPSLGLSQEMKKFTGTGADMLETLVKGSVRGLTTDDDVFSEKQWTQLRETYQQWKEAAESKKLQSKVKPLVQDIKKTMTLFDHDFQKPEYSNLWKAQQILMDAVFQYEHLLKS